MRRSETRRVKFGSFANESEDDDIKTKAKLGLFTIQNKHQNNSQIRKDKRIKEDNREMKNNIHYIIQIFRTDRSRSNSREKE